MVLAIAIALIWCSGLLAGRYVWPHRPEPIKEPRP